MSEFRRKLMMAYAANLGRGDIIYPRLIAAWSADSVEVKQGERYQCDDLLWECIKGHTTQSNWKPSLETASLWKVVDEEHAGTQEDPIPYTPPMEIFKDKYYTQSEVLYKCTRNSEIPLSQNLSELVGTYVETVVPVNLMRTVDVIDYVPPMIIKKDSFYKEDGVVYKCTQSSKLPISNKLKDLVGYYVEIYS